MKKILFSIIIAFMVNTMASAITINGITYDIIAGDGPTVLVASCSCSGAVEIPAQVTWDNVTYKVASIGSRAFNNCTGVTSVTIAEGVEGIGSMAFQSCTGLTSVTIPGSVTTIENMAFDGCRNLTDVTIPGSVTRIGDAAFRGCKGLTSIVFPESVRTIDYMAFSGCARLTSIVIPESVTSIGKFAFSNCISLNSIKFGNAMMSITKEAFDGCYNVKSVTFLGVISLDNIFEGIGTAESPVALRLPSLWPKSDKPVNSKTPWHGGYFNCEYVDPVKEFLGSLGTEQEGNAVEVIKGDKKVILYNPDKVNFIKVTTEE